MLQGDFNFQPSWPQYRIITEGDIEAAHPHYPPLPPSDPWLPHVDQPLRSALRVKWGKEPDFTCYSYADRVGRGDCVKPREPWGAVAIKYQKLIYSGTQESGERFCAPLDYIFVSSEWKVEDAIKLQSKDEALKMPCPFPNQVSKQKELNQQQQS